MMTGAAFYLCLVVLLCSFVCLHAQKPTLQTFSKDIFKQPTNNQSKLSRDSGAFRISKDRDDQGVTGQISVHLLSISEQINSKLDIMQSKFECLEKDIKEVKTDTNAALNGIRDEIKEVKTGAESSSNRIGDEIKEVKTNTDAALNRIRDNIKEVKTDTDAALNRLREDVEEIGTQVFAVEQRLSSKLTTEVSHMADKIELLEYQRSEQNKQVHDSGDLPIPDIKTELGKFSDRIASNFTQTIESLRQGWVCEEHAISEDAYNSSKGRQLLERIDKRIEDISAGLIEKVNTDHVTVDSRQDQRPLSNQTTSTDAAVQNVKSVLREALMPTKCVKGMVAAPYSIIYPSNDDVITAPYVCDSHTTGGGWIVFQRRESGSTSFDRNWSEYKTGFGPLSDDFWLGLDAVHNLTRNATYQLRMDLIANGKPYYAEFSTFAVSAEAENYVLQLGDHSGTAPDHLSYHKWMMFSTADKDNDKDSGNCADSRNSGWWYKACSHVNLNQGNPKSRNMQWAGLSYVSKSEMKIRRVNKEP